jgi:hypothetical protein
MKKKKDKETTIKIIFANEEAAHHFAIWLCESGEQQYWEWMEYREREEKGDITAVSFHYHGPEDESKEENDPARYGEFMCDNTIRTTLGRLDHGENTIRTTLGRLDHGEEDDEQQD